VNFLFYLFADCIEPADFRDDTLEHRRITSDMELVIVIPFLDDQPSFNVLVERLSQNVKSFHLVVVDDGSLMSPVDEAFLQESIGSWTHIILKRNSGPQRAIAVGLNHVYNNFDFKNVLVMDGDGEDSPETVSDLLDFQRSQTPVPDICVVTRLSRENSLWFKLLYLIYKFFFWAFTGRQMNFGHYSLLSREAVSRIINYPQLWIHLGSTYLLSRMPISKYPLSRGKRYQGRSRVNITSLVNHGLRSVVAQSERAIPRVILANVILLFSAALIFTVGNLFKWKLLFYFATLIFLFSQSLVTATILIMLLSISRNSGEYDSSNYQTLVKYVSRSQSDK